MNQTQDEPLELKAQDAPIEVLIFDPLSMPLAGFLYRWVPALQVTLLALLVRIAGAVCIVVDSFIWASSMLFIGFLLDAMDGKMARRQKRHVELHGTSDFLLDQIALVILLLAIMYSGAAPSSFLVLLWFAAYFLLIAVGGTRFRLLGQLKIDWREARGTRKALAGRGDSGFLGRIYGILIRVEQPFRERRMVARPTSIESLFCICIIGPLAAFADWTWILAVVLLLPDLLASLLSIFLMARAIDRAAR